MSDDERFIRDWIAEIVAERKGGFPGACPVYPGPERLAVLEKRELKLGGLLPPATGTLAFLLDPSKL